jgi:hypothetical protein
MHDGRAHTEEPAMTRTPSFALAPDAHDLHVYHHDRPRGARRIRRHLHLVAPHVHAHGPVHEIGPRPSLLELFRDVDRSAPPRPEPAAPEPTPEILARIRSTPPPPPRVEDRPEDTILRLDVPLDPLPVVVDIGARRGRTARLFVWLSLTEALVATAIAGALLVRVVDEAPGVALPVPAASTLAPSPSPVPVADAPRPSPRVVASVTPPVAAPAVVTASATLVAAPLSAGSRRRHAERERIAEALRSLAPSPGDPVATEPTAPVPAEPPAPARPAPSREVIQAAFADVRDAIETCAAGRHGRVTVTANVRPDGRVSGAVVTGGFAGTPEGSCVARTARSVRVPAFDGAALSVSYPFDL